MQTGVGMDKCMIHTEKKGILKMDNVLNEITYKDAKFNHKIINIHTQVIQLLGSLSVYADFSINTNNSKKVKHADQRI